jgi:hypothetical protein
MNNNKLIKINFKKIIWFNISLIIQKDKEFKLVLENLFAKLFKSIPLIPFESYTRSIIYHLNR